jgi:hypothetical protein
MYVYTYILCICYMKSKHVLYIHKCMYSTTEVAAILMNAAKSQSNITATVVLRSLSQLVVHHNT